MKKIIKWFKDHRPTKRRLIQLYAALLHNANLKGFGKGKIYTGPLKNICSPGLNCYSCPAASGACPLGALQNGLASSGARAPYYVFGIIILYGFLFGRWICSFLCPFGLVQELLHKLPTPKLKKNRVTRVLSYLKYVILVFFVGIVPIAYALRNFPLPGFCKYICPAGTLEGAMGLLSNSVNEGYLRMLGPLFTWKFLLMVSILVACVFIFRFFCRFICPLGALYGLFNRISLLGVTVDTPSCTECGICVNKCKMDVKRVGDQECISCGECISSCPTGAIRWKGSKLLLAPNAIAPIPADATEDEQQSIREKNEQTTAKIARRNKILKITVASLMTVLLASLLIYYNFFDGREQSPAPTPGGDVNQGPVVGTAIGNICPDLSLLLPENDEQFNVQAQKGQVVVLNFWYTTCGPCVEELPHFNEVANEYASSVKLVAIHIEMPGVDALEWIDDNYPEWLEGNMLVAWDEGKIAQGMFGVQACPTTVVINGEGVITDVFDGMVTQEELVAAIEKAGAVK